MRDYRGNFEVHITVQTAHEAVLGRFRAWCRERDLKCVRIVLARGEHVEQPMATCRRCATTLPRVLDEAQQFAADLGRAGISVARVKIEAAPHNSEVPIDDIEAATHEAGNYFEHHVKLLRDACAPLEAILRSCGKHGVHLSRNAFREVADGLEERFVTLRSYRVGRDTSDLQLKRLLAELNELGEHIVELESEYCVYDSNLDLDAGWLSQPR